MNEINTSDVLSQIRALSAQIQPPTPAGETAPSDPVEFSSMLKDAVDGVNDIQKNASRMAAAFETGKGDIPITDVMIELQKSSLAFQTMLTVRNKLVSAYQEIMSMPI